jgi:hypothetical protein
LVVFFLGVAFLVLAGPHFLQGIKLSALEVIRWNIFIIENGNCQAAG